MRKSSSQLVSYKLSIKQDCLDFFFTYATYNENISVKIYYTRRGYLASIKEHGMSWVNEIRSKLS
jgi:hypothetical protein